MALYSKIWVDIKLNLHIKSHSAWTKCNVISVFDVNLTTALNGVPDDEEGDEVDVGEVGAAAGRVARVLAPLVADDVGALEAGEHDVLPGLARRRAEEHEDRLEERLEVVVAVDLGALLRRDLAKHLKSHGGELIDSLSLNLIEHVAVWGGRDSKEGMR